MIVVMNFGKEFSFFCIKKRLFPASLKD